jgi:phosphomannomutase
MIKDFPDMEFIGGGEESFGFLTGDFVRDKDAVTATLLACEMAAQKKSDNRDLYQYLLDIFSEFGYYKEHLISIVKMGKTGAEEIAAMMKKFRENPFDEIAGSKVLRLEDYQAGTGMDMNNGSSYSIDIPKSNVLIYYTEDGSKIAMRPSGTEPKIKFYISVNTPYKDNIDTEELLQNKINTIISCLNT